MPYLHWICINTGKTWVMFNRMETAETGVHVRRRKSLTVTAWKVFKYEVFSGPYFPVFGLKTKIYCVWFRDFVQGKVIKIYRFRQFAFLISAIYTTRSFLLQPLCHGQLKLISLNIFVGSLSCRSSRPE